jgi:hypothetical protein
VAICFVMCSPHFQSVIAVVAITMLLPTRAHAEELEEQVVVAPEEIVRGPVVDPSMRPRPWPRGRDVPPPPERAREGPRGSGGVAVLAVRGTRNGRGDLPITGAHVNAAWRFGHTRFGASLAVQRDTGLLLTPKYAHEVHGSGPSTRLGGTIGWGAPWNDSFIGFVGEVGVAAGIASGTARRTITTTYASPYGGAWLMLQVPWRLPVRPVAGLGMVWMPMIPDSLPVSILGELGFAWHAW